MEREQFWSIIDSIKDADNRAEALRQKLEAHTDTDIVAFQGHFDTLFNEAYEWNLWGAAYLMNGGCSDDGFIDFRYGLISLGRETFEAALGNPDSLADSSFEPDEIEDELFGYVASEVYEQKTGKQMPRNGDFPEEPNGEEWDFDDEYECKTHLPKLTIRYY